MVGKVVHFLCIQGRENRRVWYVQFPKCRIKYLRTNFLYVLNWVFFCVSSHLAKRQTGATPNGHTGTAAGFGAFDQPDEL